MKQRGIGNRFSLEVAGQDCDQGTLRAGRKSGREGLSRALGRGALETRHELVQLQLLQALAHRVQLARGELDQALALLAELERLAQAGLVRVEPPDDLLEPLDGPLVRHRLSAHRASSVSPFSSTCASTLPSASRALKRPAARTADAPGSSSPRSSRRTA